jgi:hypothetical protein
MFDLFFGLDDWFAWVFPKVQAIQTGQSNKTESRSVHRGERSRQVKAIKQKVHPFTEVNGQGWSKH